MLIRMWWILLGAQHQAAKLYSPSMKNWPIIVVQVARNIIASNADVLCILIYLANNSKKLRTLISLIEILWSLLKEQSINSVLTVNFGYKKMRVAIIWRVDVNINSVMFVGENMAHVNVLKRLEVIDRFILMKITKICFIWFIEFALFALFTLLIFTLNLI